MKKALLFLLLFAFCRMLCAQVYPPQLSPAQPAEGKVLAEIRPSAFSGSSILFHPGVFRLDEASNTLLGLYILSNGSWQRVQTQPPFKPILCGTARPPSDLIWKIAPPPLDGAPHWVVGNLGITSEQWARARDLRTDTSVPESNLLKKIGKAVNLECANGATRWQFDSMRFPEGFRAEIPGSGIYFHMQENFPQKETKSLFDGNAKVLLIEAKVGMPELKVEGSATTTVTIGVGMQTKDVRGNVAPLLLIVNIMHSRGDSGEHVGSDGRNTYAGSSLTDTATFIDTVEGCQQFGPWEGRTMFSFKIDADAIARLIKATNAKRAKLGQPLLDTNPASVRFKGVDLRNESRFLDKGSVRIVLETEYLRAIRL